MNAPTYHVETMQSVSTHLAFIDVIVTVVTDALEEFVSVSSLQLPMTRSDWLPD